MSSVAAFSAREFVLRAADAFQARPDPGRGSFFAGHVRVEPDATMEDALAAVDTETGTLWLSESTVRCLEKIDDGRLRTKKDFRAARDALVTLFHEFNHFAAPAGRHWLPGRMRYSSRRGARALEEGTSELAAQDEQRFKGFVGRLGFRPEVQVEIFNATAEPAYCHFSSAVDSYLCAVTQDTRGYADGLDRVNAVDADQKPAMLAEVTLEQSPLRSMVSKNRYAEIRAEIEQEIVRGFDELPQLDDADDRTQIKAGRRAGRAMSRRATRLLKVQHARALRQGDIKSRWAAAEQDFAVQELRCAADLRIGTPGAVTRFSEAAIQHQAVLQSLRLEQLTLVSEEAAGERTALARLSVHYRDQELKAVDRQANPVADSADHDSAKSHEETFVLVRDTDTHRLRALDEWESAHVDDTRRHHDLAAHETDQWRRIAFEGQPLDATELERHARGRQAWVHRLEAAKLDVRDPDLPGGGALSVGRYAPMQMAPPAASVAFNGLRPAARASVHPKAHPSRGVARSNDAAGSFVQRRPERAQD